MRCCSPRGSPVAMLRLLACAEQSSARTNSKRCHLCRTNLCAGCRNPEPIKVRPFPGHPGLTLRGQSVCHGQGRTRGSTTRMHRQTTHHLPKKPSHSVAYTGELSSVRRCAHSSGMATSGARAPPSVEEKMWISAHAARGALCPVRVVVGNPHARRRRWRHFGRLRRGRAQHGGRGPPMHGPCRCTPAGPHGGPLCISCGHFFRGGRPPDTPSDKPPGVERRPGPGPGPLRRPAERGPGVAARALS